MVGVNVFIIVDVNVLGGCCKMIFLEYVLFFVLQDFLKCVGWGLLMLIFDKYVFNVIEVNVICMVVVVYNVKL